MEVEGEEAGVSTRRGPARQDCVSWALADNGRSYHELLRLEKVVCRCPYLPLPGIYTHH